MSKVRSWLEINSKNSKYINDLCRVIVLLKNEDMAKTLFLGLLTESEAIMFSRRIEIGKMLLRGRTYNEIKLKLKAGSNTISRVERWLSRGISDLEALIGEIELALSDKKGKRRNRVLRKSTKISKLYPIHAYIINSILMD